MPQQRVVIITGSKSDLDFASSIGQVLKDYAVDYEYAVASAHRTPEHLLKILKDYEGSGDNIVYITVAGLSDALSGLVAGFTKYPVIACPPDAEKYGWPKVFSSAMTPEGVAVSLVPKPENAALAAIKILALSNSSLYERIIRRKQEREEAVLKAHRELKERKTSD
ncbi:MAG: AIR carboxylase family protein [Candidatus Bathyarchaeia archaeon]